MEIPSLILNPDCTTAVFKPKDIYGFSLQDIACSTAQCKLVNEVAKQPTEAQIWLIEECLFCLKTSYMHAM